MKSAVPSGPQTIGPATGAFPLKVHRTVALGLFCPSVLEICAEAMVGVAVTVGHGGQEPELTPTPTVIGWDVIPLEVALIQAQPSFRPVYCPPWLLVGGCSTCVPPGGLLLEVQRVLMEFVMSAKVVCLPLTSTP